ncbi:putative polyketide synthase [Triangularia verruculosa]|uniref:Polyketide synthase n=1 Tax=Triangularia verruculosa TaxID=2587418 RepID=A0AAN6XPV4_9PEZI|nr:putative polyketide synthase [Triangularia verruculosa]
MSYKPSPAEPIAIIGMGCRFAGGADSPSRLWRLLIHPKDVSKCVPESRFKVDAFYHPDGEHPGTTNSPRAYFLEQDHRVFDASFFNTTPKEAEAMDPQQRMLLEVVYEALESAGYRIQAHAGARVGVFAGLMTADYDTLSQRDELTTSQYYATGNARSMMANRLSYFFDFKGPSMTIDTACSSSLVALHQAVLSLRSGDCEMACVAGANLILTPEQFIVESSLHMLSPSGHCNMFDANADGYARGEGIAAMFVRPLSKAIENCDPILAVIRETGVNSDGRTTGITMPNWEAQAQLIQETYRRAGLDIDTLEDRCQYFECHGTGTGAGDPNEARAIEHAFFSSELQDASEKPRLVVGSVKTVIGHTEGAAGLAGLFKVVESIRHDTVPPNLHLHQLSPQVAQYAAHLKVPTSPIEWPKVQPGQPKRASINSFGFGGTNAHAIIEQYVPALQDKNFAPNILLDSFTAGAPRVGGPAPAVNRVCLPLLLSARSEKSLVAVVQTYHDYVLKYPLTPPEELAWHTYARRTAHAFRLAISSTSTEHLLQKLSKILHKAKAASTTTGLIEQLGNIDQLAEAAPSTTTGCRVRPETQKPRLLGVFTGQGAQWATMSRGLLVTSRVYRDCIRELDKILQHCPHPPPWNLEHEILADEGLSRVNKSAISQPLCAAIQIALVDLMHSIGVSFHTVVGHSSGEIGAAYAAGRLSARDAILAAYYRGMDVHLARGANGNSGRMLAAGLSKEDAVELCSRKEFSQGLCIAAHNSPESVTLSGDRILIQRAYEELAYQQHKFVRVLHVDTAYHSPHMEALSVKYLDAIKACKLTPMPHNNGTAWISSVSGTGEPDVTDLKDTYWRDNMVRPVLFCEAVTTALTSFGPFDAAIEVGPHCALKGPALQTIQQISGDTIPYIGLLNRSLDDREAFSHFLGWIWTRFGFYNSHIWDFVQGSVQPELVKGRIPSAPSYPWDHSQVHWRESRVSRQYHFKLEMPHELLGVRTRDDNQHQLRWRNVLKLEKLTWLRHHTFQGQALLPASAYIVMAVDAAKAALPGRAISLVELRNLKFLTGITFEPNSSGIEVLSSLIMEKNTPEKVEASFMLTSTMADGRTDMKKNFAARVILTLSTPSAYALPARQVTRAETLSANPEAFYSMMASTGLNYTGPFRGLQSLTRRYNHASATRSRVLPEDSTRLGISPATLDSCLQVSFVTVSSPGDGAIWTAFLPVEIESVRLNLSLCDKQGLQDTLTVDAYLTESMPFTKASPASFTADVEIFNDDGQCEIQIEGLKVGSLGPTKPEDDHELFLTTQLDVDPEDSIISATEDDMHPLSAMLAESCERVASFYIKTLTASAMCPVAGSHLVSDCDACRTTVLRAKSSWPQESEETLDAFILSSRYYSALNLIRRLGQNIPDVLAGMLSTVFEEAHQLYGFQRHISRVIKQIAHKYALLNVLGLTDAELGLSEHVLTGLGDSFQSYRIGAESEKSFEHRIRAPDSLHKKVILEEVDFRTDVPRNSQLYDVVLLSTSLFDTHNTSTVLGHVRDMMRPGGFLMLIHVTRTPLQQRLSRCVTPASRPSMPPTPPDWPDLLEQCGFFNASDNSTQHYASGFSLIVRQAQSLEKEQLKYPAGDKKPARLMDRLLIVGGKQLWTSLISAGVSAALALHFGLIITVESLEDIAFEHLSHFGAVIFLGELDESVLMNMSEMRMEALKELLRPEMVILWVTESARGCLPENSATLGFTRTLAAEIPGLTLQVLDLETINTAPAVKAVSEAFFRLAIHARLLTTSVEGPLWVLEPEIHIKDGRRMVPRVLPWKQGNDRANACRRLVTVMHNSLENVVEILPCQSGNGPYRAERWELPSTFDSDSPDDVFDLQVRYSTANSMNSGINSLTCLYVCLGRDMNTNTTKVALAKANASYIAMPEGCVTEITKSDLNEPAFFALLVRYYLALTISYQAKNRPLLVIEPDTLFQECVKDVSVRSGEWFQIFSTNEERCNQIPGMVFLHSALSRREVNDLHLPKEALVLDMLPIGHGLTEMLKTAVGESCSYLHISSVLRPRAHGGVSKVPKTAITCAVLESLWNRAVDYSLAKMEKLPSNIDTGLISVPDLLLAREPTAPFGTIHWQAEREIEHIVVPPNGLQLLSPLKTYLLVGMTRDFGQSLCTLLVQLGARLIVLASRNPPKELPQWAVELQKPGRGVRIRFETLDVTSSEQVTALKTRIAQVHRFPTVGGVVNGAMVLDDRVLSEMSLESFQRVMAPKTIGSRNLDDAFCTTEMDFFIMTSSFAAIGGHAGQSNYAAANMFMNGLAAWRRHRGFVGSVLNIGVIYGLGFLHREKENLYEGLEREGYPPISERDLHHMFIEAIAVGKPKEDQIYDLTTGLRRFPVGRPTLHWHRDPRFCHYIRNDDDSDADADSSGPQELSLKEQINGANSQDDLVQVLVQAFMKRLQTQLKLPEGNVTADHSIIELGVDSLAAVEIRVWVWKTTGHDVAVMKILSGTTIAQLCEEIAKTIMAVRLTQDSLAATVPSDASATPHTTSVVSGAELEMQSVATTAEE